MPLDPAISTPRPSPLPFAEPPPGINFAAPRPFQPANPQQATALLREAIAQSNTPVPTRPLVQLPPSTAQPLPNLQSAGLTSPTGIATGSVPTPISNVPTPAAIPGGVIRPPIPIGRIAGGAAVGGVVDFGARLASGQPVGHAAMGASATTAGSAILGAAGFAVAGPVGAMLGGMAGGAIAGAAFDALNPPTTAELNPSFDPTPYGDALSFPYLVRVRYWHAPSGTWAIGQGYGFNLAYFKASDGRFYHFIQFIETPGGTIKEGSGQIYNPDFGLSFPDNNLPANVGQPKADARALPRGVPASPIVSNPPRSVVIPPGPGAAAQPGGPRNLPTGKTPAAPADASNLGSQLPQLQRQPSSAPKPQLDFAPFPDKPRLDLVPNLLQTAQPGPNNRGTNLTPLGGLAGPSPDLLTQSATPTAEAQTAKAPAPAPDSQKPPTPTAPTPETADKDLVDRLTSMEVQLTTMAAAIATLLARPLSTPGLSPEEAKKAAADGTCETLKPDACMRKEFDKTNEINQNNSTKLDKIDAAMQGLDLAGVAALNTKVDKIDTKLGPQVAGGISGKLGEIFNKFTEVLDNAKDIANKTWESLGLDRVVAVMNLVFSLHNAAMISRELGETLVDTAETVIQALQAMIPGFLKRADGENLEIDLSEVLSTKVENFLKASLGNDNYFSLKASWMKANRILTASSNALSAVRGMNNAITDGLESVQTCVSQGFNGIQREGLVSDKTWPWMDETPNFKSNQITRFTNRVENAEDATSSIQQIAQAPIEFVSEAKELTEATTELKKALDEDSQKTAAAEAKKDAESEAAEIAEDDLLPGGG